MRSYEKEKEQDSCMKNWCQYVKRQKRWKHMFLGASESWYSALSITYTLETKPKPKPITCLFHTFPALCFAPVLSAGSGLETGLPIWDWSFPKWTGHSRNKRQATRLRGMKPVINQRLWYNFVYGCANQLYIKRKTRG